MLAAVGRAPAAPFWLKQVQAGEGGRKGTDFHAWVGPVSPFPDPICYPSLAGCRCRSAVTNAERMLARSEAASLGVGRILPPLFCPFSSRSPPHIPDGNRFNPFPRRGWGHSARHCRIAPRGHGRRLSLQRWGRVGPRTPRAEDSTPSTGWKYYYYYIVLL